MKRSEIRIRQDIQYTRVSRFVDKCKRLKKEHFTRNRKMPLKDLLLSILNRKGLTLAMELKKFYKSLGKSSSISKVGYLKQRMKLNPEALLDLNVFHTKNFYKDVEHIKKLNGYFIFAADGSGINIPTTRETIENYGSSSRKGTKPQASLGLSCLYDVMNKMILDCSINRCKFNESAQAEIHLRKVSEIIGDKKYMILLDRGYPSLPLFIRLMKQGSNYLVRLKSSDFKAEKSLMRTADEEVSISFTKSRLAHYIDTEIGAEMQQMKQITIRMVRIELDSGEDEYLATNLSKSEFGRQEIAKIYAMRWGIETAFDILKNKLELENFTGTKPILLEQDIYSCVYLCNLIQDIVAEANEELHLQEAQKYKYEMAVNISLSIGILKEDFIEFILTKDSIKKTELFEKILTEIKSNLVPIRPDRHYKRTRGQLAGKYSNTHKRSY